MELQGKRSHWQNGKYFDSWSSYVANCPNCKKELFNKKNQYRDLSKVVQCPCGSRIKYNSALQNSTISRLITTHTFEIITTEKSTMAEQSRTQVLKSQNKDLKNSLEANRIELRDIANTTVDGRPGNNSALEAKEVELADKLLNNNLELCEIELTKVKAKFKTKKANLDKKKLALEEKVQTAEDALVEFNKADGAYSLNEKARKEAIDVIVLRKGQLQNAKDYQ